MRYGGVEGKDGLEGKGWEGDTDCSTSRKGKRRVGQSLGRGWRKEGKR